jgi:hypothetical protein
MQARMCLHPAAPRNLCCPEAAALARNAREAASRMGALGIGALGHRSSSIEHRAWRMAHRQSRRGDERHRAGSGRAAGGRRLASPSAVRCCYASDGAHCKRSNIPMQSCTLDAAIHERGHTSHSGQGRCSRLPCRRVDERAHPIGPQAGAPTGGAAICGTVDCLVQAAGGRGGRGAGGQGVRQGHDG